MALKVAAVMMESKAFDVSYNMELVEQYVKQGAKDKIELMVFPEFFTSGFALDVHMYQAIVESQVVGDKMRELSREYKMILCGSYLMYHKEKDVVLNTFRIFMPDGTVYEHSKDIPTAIEAMYYCKGDSNRVFDTAVGRIGVVMCWEQLRYKTVKEMCGKVDFVVAGSCWWNFCKEDGEKFYEQFHDVNRELAREAPAKFAKLLGVPVIHASHVGNFPGSSIGKKKTKCIREIEGYAEIVNGNGDVIIRHTEKSKKPYVVTNLTLNESERKKKVRTLDYWIPKLPLKLKMAFYTANHNCHKRYCKYTVKKVKSLMR